MIVRLGVAAVTPSSTKPSLLQTLSQNVHAPHFEGYFNWMNLDRKRKVGDPVVATTGRRLRSGRWATAAGVQLRRTAMPPPLPSEVEPGIAIKELSHLAYPFTVPA